MQSSEWKDWTSTWRKVGNYSQTRHVTMTGTIMRGKKKGQSVDVELDLTEQELTQLSIPQENLNSTARSNDANDEDDSKCSCGLTSGLHIVLFGIVSLPFVFIGAIFVSMYFGLLTWQNLFSHFYDERTIWHRICVCPFLVIFFPIFITIISFSIALYAAVVQISWTYDDWKTEIGSFEKGFYGWVCSWMNLESCSPYSVVILDEPESPILSNMTEDNEISLQPNTSRQNNNNGRSGRDRSTHLVHALPVSGNSHHSHRESEM